MSNLDTFTLTDKDKYKAFWNKVGARNDGLTKGSGRVVWILEAVKSASPNDILEIGCQTGGITRFLLEITDRVRAVDIVIENLKIVEEMGAVPLLAFAEDLHQHKELGLYDSVVMTELLNVVTDAEKATANAWARVRQGGNLVITVPIGNRWTDQSTAREFNSTDDLQNILSVATGYGRIPIETLSHKGVDYFYACNLKKRAKRRGADIRS